MKGTWQTTGSSGSGAAAAVIIALVLIGSGAVAALAEALVWILAVAAVCGVLALAGALSLMRRTRRQAAEVGAELAERRRLARSDRPGRPIALEAVVQPPSEPRPQLEGSDKPAIHHHHGPDFHIYGADGQDAAARLIRKALTEGE